jgi:hypothetical protein
MNERIKQLLEQCQIETYGVNGELLEIGFDAEKFAQLIIQECIDIISPYTVRMSRPGEEYLHPIPEIKEHFGVEQ